jgi:hypothetical protein
MARFFIRSLKKLMADNKTLRDNRDRGKVAADEKYEVDYFVEKFSVSKKQVTDAIKEVGNDRKKLEAHFKKNK